MSKNYLSVLFVVLLTGCAAQLYRPIVDARSVKSHAQLEHDTQECRQYALQVAGPGTGAVAGAVAGAVLGAVVARVVSRDANRGQAARFGALLGAGSGAGSGAASEMHVIRECLKGRGYTVLN